MPRWVIVVLMLFPWAPSLQADQPQVEIVKVPAQVGTRYVDPKRPPRDRSPLGGPEEAVNAGDFLSDASVGAQAMQTDATHANPVQAEAMPAAASPPVIKSDKRAVPKF